MKKRKKERKKAISSKESRTYSNTLTLYADSLAFFKVMFSRELAYSSLTLPNFKFLSLYFEFRRRYFTQKVPLSYPKNGTFYPKKWHFSPQKMALFGVKNGTFRPNKWHFLTINKKSNFKNKKSKSKKKKFK